MKLVRDLVVFDLETTGTWIEKDKIIEIAMIKYFIDGRREVYHKKVNPGITIPKVVVELTGISDEMVKDAPMFKDIVGDVLNFLADSDLAGFNIEKFDLPLLAREMQEVGVTFAWQTHKVYDSQKVFHLNEKRDLTAAYQYYCQKQLNNAHSALADTEATYEILLAQVQKYGQSKDDLTVLDQFAYRETADFYDGDRRFRWWNGKLYMMFGKYAKKYSLQEVAQKDKGYLEWILSADFNSEVKDLVQKALSGHFPVPPKESEMKGE